jgi:hypothetical protein
MMSSPAISPLAQPGNQPSQSQSNQTPDSLSSLEQLAPTDTTPSGTQTNANRSTVIVPKPGESFAHTMARALQAGQQETPADLQQPEAAAAERAAEAFAAMSNVSA